MTDFIYLLYELNGNVATITLNRPKQQNALNETLSNEIMCALQQARDDDTVRAIVLTGAGKRFCVGADLIETGISDISDPEKVADNVYNMVMTISKPTVELLREIEKPVIGAINGATAGMGVALALACDVRVMSEESYLMLAFSNIGLVPDGGSTWFFVRQLGYSLAFEYAIEATRITASRCLELGLTNRVVPNDVLLSSAQEWATHLAQRPTFAIALTKQALNYAANHSLSHAIEHEVELQKLALMSQDHHEGITAFFEKRKPVFKGK
ncbi:MAG: hypothetical protein B6242_00675 [Anaerolineaceae bacterium 4572_78]|nr:MAG: hypothetical protein B6242_00675 [Anaerolineaceae bacterium 4572_78]